MSTCRCNPFMRTMVPNLPPTPSPQAMVDVISSNGWLNPALAAMEMSQMASQVGQTAMSNHESWQPFLTWHALFVMACLSRGLAARCLAGSLLLSRAG